MKRGRGPLTGIREPEYNSEEPWQTQEAARVIHGLSSGSSNSHLAIKILVLTLAAVILLFLVGPILLAIGS